MTDVPPPPAGYRPCVGAAVFADDGRVFLGRRADLAADAAHAWQLPQGGIDPGEDPEAAARRELLEETGIRSVRLIGRTDGWITYDFPPGVRGRKFKQYKGQTQLWFAYAWLGEDAEIDLGRGAEAEFSAWKWAPLETISETIVPFKRPVYEAIVTAFRPLIPQPTSQR